ncbi:MAG TPA: hypothetical protein VIK08_00475 [Candidatus Limnocylindrales bacterium]
MSDSVAAPWQPLAQLQAKMSESDCSDFEAAIKAADSMSDGDAVALASSVVTDRRADYCSIEAADLTR